MLRNEQNQNKGGTWHEVIHALRCWNQQQVKPPALILQTERWPVAWDAAVKAVRLFYCAAGRPCSSLTHWHFVLWGSIYFTAPPMTHSFTHHPSPLSLFWKLKAEVRGVQGGHQCAKSLKSSWRRLLSYGNVAMSGWHRAPIDLSSFLEIGACCLLVSFVIYSPASTSSAQPQHSLGTACAVISDAAAASCCMSTTN